MVRAFQKIIEKMNFYMIYKYLQTCKEFTANKSSIKIFTHNSISYSNEIWRHIYFLGITKAEWINTM